MMKRALTAAALACMGCIARVAANACSVAGCLGHGIEMQPSFVVRVRHAGRSLTAAAVHIKGNGQELTVLTDQAGKARISDLSSGDYWLDVQFLGIGAAYQCFHVADRPPGKAKRKLSYDWGDEAPATQHIAGRLIDVQPNTAGSPLWNLLHAAEVPIIGASLKLQNPAGVIYTTASDSQGYFAFETIPAATYVLHIEGGSAGHRDYDATDQLIELSPRASSNKLVFKRRDAGGGSCGGTYLELEARTEP